MWRNLESIILSERSQSRKIAYYMIPFSKFVEMNGYEMTEFRSQFGIADDITDDTPWGEVEATITLEKYVGAEYLDQFKEQ